MSLLSLPTDIENDVDYDINIINRIYQMWLSGSGAYRACGFYKGIYADKIKELPEDWMDWVLYHCTHLSNYGDFCCVIAPPNFDPEFNVYESFKIRDWTNPDVYINGYPACIEYTVRHLLDWYENNK